MGRKKEYSNHIPIDYVKKHSIYRESLKKYKCYLAKRAKSKEKHFSRFGRGNEKKSLIAYRTNENWAKVGNLEAIWNWDR